MSEQKHWEDFMRYESRGTIGEFKHWPNRNPYNKAWFQRQACRRWMEARRWRLADIATRWSDRCWDKGLPETERIAQGFAAALAMASLIRNGICDWRAFPEWVQKARAK